MNIDIHIIIDVNIEYYIIYYLFPIGYSLLAILLLVNTISPHPNVYPHSNLYSHLDRSPTSPPGPSAPVPIPQGNCIALGENEPRVLQHSLLNSRNNNYAKYDSKTYEKYKFISQPNLYPHLI